MQVTQGSLTIVNIHTATPVVLWNGIKLENLRRIKIKYGENDGPVKIVVAGTQDQIYAEMMIAGIQVKKVTT